MEDHSARVDRILREISNPLIRPGLSRMAKLLSKLGHPERTFRAVHVVGTNGKGSISAMLESILLEAGYSTCMYTSPHLADIGERLRFSGVNARAEDLLPFVMAVAGMLEPNSGPFEKPTYFETLTAAAFMAISSYVPDVAIIEAGMGGRMDATNILSNVSMTVISSLGSDHSEYLGHTLEAIAMEKFLVLRPEGMSVFSGGDRNLEDIYETLCHKIANNGTVASQTGMTRNPSVGIDGNMFEISIDGGPWIEINTSLGGGFQLTNAVTAIIAASRLSLVYPLITLDPIRRGLAVTRWPGRLEKVKFGNGNLILDGAHNPDGISALADTFSLSGLSNSTAVVFGAMKDKDLKSMIRKICDSFPMIVFTAVPGSERSADPESLYRIAKDFNPSADLSIEMEPLTAIEKASKIFDTVLCCGSLFLAGAVKTALGKKFPSGVPYEGK